VVTGRPIADRPSADGVRRRFAILLGLLLAANLVSPWSAGAAGPPAIPATWVTGVTPTSAVLRAEIDPEGLSTRYRFEYLSLAAYEANLAGGQEAFAGAGKAPAVDAGLGSGTTPVPVSFTLSGPVNPLTPGTAYRFRAVATNGAGTTPGPVRSLRTEAAGPPPGLPDARAWEMVSPVDKGGGAVAGPRGLFGGGEIQAAAGGGALTYGSATAFAEPSAAPPVSQYLSTRSASGWVTRNISVPLESGGYGDRPDGAPYRLFSEDLARALLLNPRRCEPAEPCPRSYSLRETATGALTSLPPEAAGMRVLSASPDLGRVLFEDEAGEVFAWSGGGLVPSEAPAEPNPGGGVVGVLGASASADIIYYQDAAGLKRWQNGVITTIVAGPDAAAPSNWPAPTGTARVTADGEHLAFLSAAAIPPFDNTDAETGLPDTEVYLYDAAAASLLCVSCNPTGERPGGSASIPGALVNGTTSVYRPRVLSADGRRLFFDSEDALVSGDTDAATDVYQWEATGEGSCTEAPGCVSLISGGRGEGGTFLDASADGADVYFLTGDSLVASDPGSIDAYDARIGGGLPEPQAPFPCNGDACQPLPSPPEDPTAGTAVEGPGNPPPRYVKERRRHHKHKHRHHRHHRKRSR
jgi:hypothetical protein